MAATLTIPELINQHDWLTLIAATAGRLELASVRLLAAMTHHKLNYTSGYQNQTIWARNRGSARFAYQRTDGALVRLPSNLRLTPLFPPEYLSVLHQIRWIDEPMIGFHRSEFQQNIT